MMGHEGDKGLIPRICDGLFEQISEKSKNTVSFHTEVSFMEIYNERVQDLLQKNTTSTDKTQLKVREHPKEGPYVQNLTRHLVQSYHDVEELILLGNVNRTTASTNMNDTSSRSHAIFTIRFTRAWFEDSLPCETVSKIHLVDLAGSERADATRATGARLKEGANINKSLVTLGCVISTLVLFQNIVTTKRKKQLFIPYRDSVLTWLLKDSLGGNSKTTMIATISPAEGNYGETLSTLHYASRAKNIVNSPKVNEDGSVKVIRGLQAEIEGLRKLLEEANQAPKGEPSSCVEVVEKLHENEAKVAALTKEWENKWNESHSILKEETVVLRKRRSGVVLDCQLPHLIGIDEDFLGSGIILYYIKEGQTTVGSNEALCGQDIVLQGLGLLSEHCVLQNQDGAVTLIPDDGALCLVNGSVVTAPCQLTQGSIIQLGKSAMFRFNHPTEAAVLRETHQSGLLSADSLSLMDMSKSAETLSKVMLQKPGMTEKSSQRGKQLEGELSKNSEDNGFVSENSGHLLQSTAEESQEAEAEETGTGLVNAAPVETSGSTQRAVIEAAPVKSAVPHSLDGEAHQGGVRTRDGPEQEGDRCHKSGPELTSEVPRKRVQSGARKAGCGGEVRSGDASLQQTSVPGRGDGCGIGPVGSANEIQEVTADCNEGRPDSGGSSLSSVSHLQSTEGSKFGFIPQQACTHSQFNKTPLSSQAVSCPAREATTREHTFDREMDEVRGLERVLDVRAKPSPGLGLGSLVNTMSWFVQGTARRIFNSSIVLQSLYPASKALSIVKNSKVISMVKNSYITPLVGDIHIFSFVKDLPLVQHFQLEMTQHLQAMSPVDTNVSTKNRANLVFMTPENEAENELGSFLRQDDESNEVKSERSMEYGSRLDNEQTSDSNSILWCKDARFFSQSLITFPDSLLKLQASHSDLGAALQSVLPPSLLSSQRVVALFWLKAAKRSAAEAIPALVIVMESGVFAVTENSGTLKLFYHLPLVQLKELHIGFAGHSLSLLGPTEESVLGLYTYSPSLCRELCGAMLGLLCPADSRVCDHPLLCGDCMELSLKQQGLFSDVLLDSGLRVSCSFQSSLADLSNLLYCNTLQEKSCLTDVHVQLYCCVGIYFPSKLRLIGQLFVTDTHIGLVREDMVFPPVGSVSSESSRLQFHSLSVRPLCDVRGVVVREEDSRGAVTVDVMLANVKGRGHPGCAHPSSHAQVWKLTLSCCAEAARLTNHLSNV
uniref:Kinesin motor domain-containing protein n=1 Tax=Neogobius melanostomus TaxID=47308 RepID=A0A8C6SEU0_9GOBI